MVFARVLSTNLVHQGNTPAPSPADHSQAVARVVQAVKSWSADSDTPTKFVYVLQHEYTEAGLSFHRLKNKDCAVAEALRSATKEADQVVHLAIFSKHQSGSAEYIDTAPFVCQNVSSTKEGQPTVLVVCL